MPGENTLEEYLVKIGWDLDELGYNSVREKVNGFVSGIVEKTGFISGAAVKAGVVVLDTILSVNDAAFQLLTTTAKLDYKTEFLARRMWTTEQNARSLSTALDSLGMSYEELFYATPEQFERFLELNQLGKTLEAPKELDDFLVKIREIQFEFSKLRQVAYYGTRWVSYYIGQYLGEDTDTVLDKIRNFNEYFSKNISKIAQKVAYVFGLFYRLGKAGFMFVKNIGEAVFDLFDEIDTSTWQLVATVTAAFLALRTGPIGLFISALMMILLLLEDFMVWQKGGKSLFDWSTTTRAIDDIKEAFSDLFGVLSPVEELLRTVWEIMFDDLEPVEALQKALDFIAGAFSAIASFAKDIVDALQMIKNIASGEYGEGNNEPKLRQFMNEKSSLLSFLDEKLGVLGGDYADRDTLFAKLYDAITGYIPYYSGSGNASEDAVKSTIPSYMLRGGNTSNVQNNEFKIGITGVETKTAKSIGDSVAKRIIENLQAKPIT